MRVSGARCPYQQVLLLTECKLPRGWYVAAESSAGKRRLLGFKKPFLQTQVPKRTISKWAAALGSIGESSLGDSKAPAKSQHGKEVALEKDCNRSIGSAAVLATGSQHEATADNSGCGTSDANERQFNPMARDDLHLMMQLHSELNDVPMHSVSMHHLLAQPPCSTPTKDVTPHAPSSFQDDAAETRPDDDWWQRAIDDFLTEGEKQQRAMESKRRRRRRAWKRAKERIRKLDATSTCQEGRSFSELSQREARSENDSKAHDHKAQQVHPAAAIGLGEEALVKDALLNRQGVSNEQKLKASWNQDADKEVEGRVQEGQAKETLDGVAGHVQHQFSDARARMDSVQQPNIWHSQIVRSPELQKASERRVSQDVKSCGQDCVCEGIGATEVGLSKLAGESAWHGHELGPGVHPAASNRLPTTNFDELNAWQAPSALQVQGGSPVQHSLQHYAQSDLVLGSREVEPQAAPPSAKAGSSQGEVEQECHLSASQTVYSRNRETSTNTEPEAGCTSAKPEALSTCAWPEVAPSSAEAVEVRAAVPEGGHTTHPSLPTASARFIRLGGNLPASAIRHKAKGLETPSTISRLSDATHAKKAQQQRLRNAQLGQQHVLPLIKSEMQHTPSQTQSTAEKPKRRPSSNAVVRLQSQVHSTFKLQHIPPQTDGTPQQNLAQHAMESQQGAGRLQHIRPLSAVKRNSAKVEVQQCLPLTGSQLESLHQPKPHPMSSAGPSGSLKRRLRQWSSKLTLSEWQCAVHNVSEAPEGERGAVAVALLEAISAGLYKKATAGVLTNGMAAVTASVAGSGLPEAGHILNVATFVLQKLRGKDKGQVWVPKALKAALGILVNDALKQDGLFACEREVVRLVQSLPSLQEEHCKKVWEAIEAQGLPEGASAPAVCKVLAALAHEWRTASPILWSAIIADAEAAAITARLLPARAIAIVHACARACPSRRELHNPFAETAAPSPLIAAVAAAIPALPLGAAATATMSLWQLAPNGPLTAGASARVSMLLANGGADAVPLSTAMAALECCQVCQIDLPKEGKARGALEAAIKRTCVHMSAEEVSIALVQFRHLLPQALPSPRLVQVLAQVAVKTSSPDAPASLARCVEELSQYPSAPSDALAALFDKSDAAGCAMSMRDAISVVCAAARRPDSYCTVPDALRILLHQVDELTLQGLQTVLRAIGVLNVRLCTADANVLVAAAERLAPEMAAPALSTVLWGLARVGAEVTGSLLEAVSTKSGFSQKDAARVLWALGQSKGKWPMEAMPLHALIAAVAQAPIGFGTVLTALKGLYCMGVPLSTTEGKPLIPVLVLHVCSSTDIEELVVLLQALSRAGLSPVDATFIYRAATAALQCALPSAAPPKLLWALHILAHIPENVSEGFKAQFCHAVTNSHFDGPALVFKEELLIALGWERAALSTVIGAAAQNTGRLHRQQRTEAHTGDMLSALGVERCSSGVEQVLVHLPSDALTHRVSAICHASLDLHHGH
jgi:hypothetical protein